MSTFDANIITIPKNGIRSTDYKRTTTLEIATVSVIIPTYNRIDTIERALKSVFQQSHAVHEIILVDDASNDGTAEFVAENFEDVDLIQLKKNGGPSVARNAALRKATGDFIAFLDSDDQWSPNYLENQLGIINQKPDIAMVFSDCTKITAHWAKSFIDTEPDYSFGDIIEQLLVRNFIETMSLVVIRRDALKGAGFFDSNIRITEDRDLYLRLAFQGELIHNPKDLVTRYMGDDNLVHNFELWAESIKYTHKKFFSNEYSVPYRHLIHRLRRFHAENSQNIALKHGQIFQYFNHTLEFVYHSMFNRETAKDCFFKIVKKVYRKTKKFIPDFFNKIFIKFAVPYNINKIQKLRTPTTLALYVTTKCNLACKHCFYLEELNNPNVQDITLDEVRRLAASLKHPTTITLSGGEPFLRKDLPQICESFLNSGHVRSFTIASNGTASSVMYDRCKKILELPNLEGLYIQISLDGLEETHDKIRAKDGTFKKVMNTVVDLKRLRKEYPVFRFDFHTVIMRNNIDEIEELILSVHQLGGVEHKFSFYRGSHTIFHLDHRIYSGLNADSEKYDNLEKEQILSLEEMQTIFDRICELNKELTPSFLVRSQRLKLQKMLETLKAEKRIIPCFAGAINGTIFSNGDVVLCEETTPIGNLSETSYNIEKLWNSPKANAYRKEIKNCACIDACNMCTSVNVSYPS